MAINAKIKQGMATQERTSKKATPKTYTVKKDDTLKKIAESAADYGLIVLDEAVSAYGYGMLDQAALLQLLKNEGGVRELVLTGRDPAPELKECADYVTDMRKEKHPYDRGILARKGIEF